MADKIKILKIEAQTPEKELDALKTQLEDINKTTNKVNTSLEAQAKTTIDNFKKSNKAIKENTSAYNKLSTTVTKAFGNLQKSGERQTKALVNGFNKAKEAANDFIKNFVRIDLSSIIQQGREIINVYSEYSRQTKFLGAVSAATAEEQQKLNEQSKELGRTTQFTASQVAQLQIEYAKLGFTPAQILKQTADTLNLASVAQSELGQTAAVVGSVLNAFKLEASETGRVTDVLAKAFSSSALDLTKFEVAISKVAPIARNLGFSLEGTTALLGKLVDAGFDASTAGTSLRSILLATADPAGKLAKALGQPVNSIEELVPALKSLEDRGIDTAEALELTDKRSVAAFQTFISTAGGVQELTNKLKDAKGFAEQAGKAITDDLKGDIDSLQSALEGTIIQFGEFFDSILRGLVQITTSIVRFVSENATALATAGASWLVYIGIVNRATLAQKAFNAAGRLADIAKFITPTRLAFAALTAVIVGLVKLYEELTEEQRFYNDLVQETTELATSQITKSNELFEVLKDTTVSQEQRNLALVQLQKLYPELLKNIDAETSSLAELEAAQKAVNDEIIRNVVNKTQQTKIDQLVNEQVKISTELLKAEKELIEATENSAIRAANSRSGIDLKRQDAQNKVNQLLREQSQVQARINSVGRASQDIFNSVSQALEGVNLNGQINQIDIYREQLSELETLISQTRKGLSETEDEENAALFNVLQNQLAQKRSLESKIQSIITGVVGTGESDVETVNSNTKKVVATVKRANKEIDIEREKAILAEKVRLLQFLENAGDNEQERQNLRRDSAIKLQEIDIEFLQKRIATLQGKELVDAEIKLTDKLTLLNEVRIKRQEELDQEARERKLKLEEDNLKNAERLYKAQIEAIENASKQSELDRLNAGVQFLESQEELQKRELQNEIKVIEAKLKITKDFNEQKLGITKDTLDLELELVQKQTELLKNEYVEALSGLDSDLQTELTKIAQQGALIGQSQAEVRRDSIEEEVETLKKKIKEAKDARQDSAEFEEELEKKSEELFEVRQEVRREEILKTLNFIRQTSLALSEDLDAIANASIDSATARYDAELLAAEGNAKKITEIELEKQAEIARIRQRAISATAAAQIVAEATTQAAFIGNQIERIKAIEDEGRKREAIAATALQVGKALSDELFELANERREAQTDAELERFDILIKAAEGNEKKQKALELAKQKFIAAEERKAAKRRKAQAITDSLIQTAIAVVEALPNFVLAGIIGGLGAIQTAIIAAQPIAKEGFIQEEKPIKKASQGYVVGGRKHAQGGTIIEAEKGEPVVKADSYSMIPNVVSWSNQMAGGIQYPNTKKLTPQIAGKLLELNALPSMSKGGLPMPVTLPRIPLSKAQDGILIGGSGVLQLDNAQLEYLAGRIAVKMAVVLDDRSLNNLEIAEAISEELSVGDGF